MAILRVMAFVGLGAITRVDSEACSGEIGAACVDRDLDEVSQLQHTMLKDAQQTEGTCTPACKNYGSCTHDGVCVCVPGYTGDDCNMVSELSSENYTVGCGNHFTIFAYIQPQLWGTYDGWQTCGIGKEQSPIDIRSCSSVKAEPLDISFTELSNTPRVNDGHSIEYKGEFLNVNIGGTIFTSSQFHFHTPSEHRIMGWQYAFEMHVVTGAGDGNHAVIGILFKLGKRNKCISQLLKNVLPGAGCKDHVSAVDLSCFVEQLLGPYWTYPGSLTSPPCTEGIKWNVMKNIATLSWSQLMVFKTRYAMNARPVHPLNARKVYLNNFFDRAFYGRLVL